MIKDDGRASLLGFNPIGVDDAIATWRRGCFPDLISAGRQHEDIDHANRLIGISNLISVDGGLVVTGLVGATILGYGDDTCAFEKSCVVLHADANHKLPFNGLRSLR